MTLESFVPEFVHRRLAQQATRAAEPFEEQIPAAAMMVDVVGFTAMTEDAASRSASGAEQISSLLQESFGELDQIVHDYGGKIVDFIGDALVALWSGVEHGDLARAVRLAASCAVAIQSRAENQPGGDVLRFRVAVSAGDTWLVSAGGQQGSWIPIATGDAIDQLGSVLHETEPGEVMVSAPALELLGVSDWQDVRDLEPQLPEPADSSSREPGALGDPAILHPFVPDIVRARFDAGLLGSYAEFRPASIVFVRLPRVELRDAGRLARIQEVTSMFQEEVDRFDGAVVNVLGDEKGLIGIAVWGAALHVHEDDALRALRCVLALKNRLDPTGSSDASNVPAAGVTTGSVFFGDIGGPRRRQHAMVGSSVNLAARLMQASDGTVLCDTATVAQTRRRMAFEELDSVSLKGVPGQVRVFEPIAELKPPLPGRQPLIGRAAEQAQLDFELAALTKSGSKGRLLLVEGEAGIGKSRLIGYLFERSERYPIRSVVIQGTPLASSTPYHPWRSIFTELLGGSDLASARLAEFLPDLPADRRELIEAILGLRSHAEADFTSNPSVARTALRRLFMSATASNPTLVVAEDAQWLDAPSRHLLRSLVNAPGTLIVVTMRPQSGVSAVDEFVEDAAQSTVLQLDRLSPEETAALVCQRLDVASLPHDLAIAIHDRTEGHPLFTEELTLAMRDQGILGVDANGHVHGDVERLQEAAYPATVQTTVASRIDQLPLAEQVTLRVASVIGRDFEVDAVEALHPTGLGKPELLDHLANGERHQLLIRQGPDTDGYSFKHGIITEVAYNTLPEAERRALHEKAARWLEGKVDERPSALDPAIAHHWARTDHTSEAIQALVRSADYAMSVASYREAVGFLTRAQGLDHGSSPATDRAHWSTSLGAAYRALGDLPSSHEALLEAASLLGSPMPRSRFRLALGLIWQLLRQTAHRLAPGLLTGLSPDRQDRVLRTAQTYFAMTTTTFSSQDALALFYVGLRATNEAERIPPSAVLARGYSFLTYGSGIAGRRKLAARYYQRGLKAAADAGDSRAAAEVRFNRAVFLTTIGEWDEAGSETQQAIAEYRGLGMHHDYLNALAVRAYQHLHEGHWDEAAARYAEHQEKAEALEESLHIAWSRCWGAGIAMHQGQTPAAVTELRAIEELTENVGELPTKIARLGFLALGEWWERRFSDALATAQQGLELMKQAEAFTAPHAYDGFAATARVLIAAWERALSGQGQTDPQDLQRQARRACKAMSRLGRSVAIARPRRDQLWGLYYALAGRQRKAIRTWERGLSEAGRLQIPYESALISLAMGQHVAGSEAERERHLAEARTIFEKLGAAHDLANTSRPS